MRIAIFSDNFFPELSGISDSLVESARELADRGHEVAIYAPQYREKDFSTANLPFQEIDLGPRVHIHRLSAISYPVATKQGRAIIPTFFRWWSLCGVSRPDIIHTHLFFGAGIEALVASWALGIPLIGTSHTPIEEFVRYSPIGGKYIAKIASRFVAWYYNRCEFVTAPSQGILDEMRLSGFKRPSRALSNPIDLKRFVPTNDEGRKRAKEKFGLSDITVLYTGRLAEEKHIDVLIRAIARVVKEIPEVMLAITGHGSSEEALRTLSVSLGVADRVKFFGTLSVEDHALIYQGSEIFAIASTAETQSLSLMKAMAVGIPVIGVNARALPEYIHPENGFVVEPGDDAAIAEKIILLANHSEMQNSLGQAGTRLVSQFSPEYIAGEWEKLYQETSQKYQEKKKTL